MIGGTLVRFHPDKMRHSGDGFGMAWRGVKKRGPGILRDFITEMATEGLKGLNLGGKGGKPNWRAGLAGVKRGATRAVKRKATQEIKRALAKKVRKDLFGV